MKRTLSLCVVIAASCSPKAMAVPTVSIGNYVATADQNVVVTVTVASAPLEQYAGLNFTFGTGPFTGPPGNPTGTGPIITAVTVIGPGMMFGANNTGQGNPNPAGPAARKVKATTTTSAGTVPATGVLATLTLSTAGLGPGIYQLRVTQMASLGGGTAMNFVTAAATTVVPNANDGELILFPEPSSVVLAALGALVLAAARRQYKRKAI